jgi:hypothetical protein
MIFVLLSRHQASTVKQILMRHCVRELVHPSSHMDYWKMQPTSDIEENIGDSYSSSLIRLQLMRNGQVIYLTIYS